MEQVPTGRGHCRFRQSRWRSRSARSRPCSLLRTPRSGMAPRRLWLRTVHHCVWRDPGQDQSVPNHSIDFFTKRPCCSWIAMWMQVIDAEQNVLIFLGNSFDFIHATQCIYLGNNMIKTRLFGQFFWFLICATQCMYLGTNVLRTRQTHNMFSKFSLFIYHPSNNVFVTR